MPKGTWSTLVAGLWAAEDETPDALEPATPGTRSDARDPQLTASEPDVADASDEPGTPVLAGTVQLATDHSPVPEFRVWVREIVPLPKVSEPEMSAFEDGRFEFASLPDGRYHICVEARGLAAWQRFDVDVADGRAEPLEVRMTAGATVRGNVIDSATGAPIADALILAEFDIPHQVVAMHGFAPTPMPYGHVRTDANGGFELPNVVPGDTMIRASHPDFAPAWKFLPDLSEGEERDAGLTELGHGAVVHGRVERADGSPWAGAELIASRMATNDPSRKLDYGYALTDANGEYRIERLPPGHYAILNVTEQPNEVPDWTRFKQLELKDEHETRADFLSAVAKPRVSGRLTYPDGSPVRDRMLSLSPGVRGQDYSRWSASPVRADGTFAFLDVKPGPHTIYLSREAGVHITYLGPLEVGPGGEENLELRLPDTHIDGRLVSDLAEPPSGGALLLEELDPVSQLWMFAGKNISSRGTFSFHHVTPGTYRLRSWGFEGLADRASNTFQVRAGSLREIELRLEPEAVLEVLLRDATGRSLDGIRVRVFDRDGLDYGSEFPLRT